MQDGTGLWEILMETMIVAECKDKRFEEIVMIVKKVTGQDPTVVIARGSATPRDLWGDENWKKVAQQSHNTNKNIIIYGRFTFHFTFGELVGYHRGVGHDALIRNKGGHRYIKMEYTTNGNYIYGMAINDKFVRDPGYHEDLEKELERLLR